MSTIPNSDNNIQNTLRNAATSLSCLSFLLPTSVTAYNNKDLLANGFIDQVGLGARFIQNPLGGEIGYDKEVVTLLPSDRIYVEFWYSVRSEITGTTLNDQGNLLGFGVLGGGSTSALNAYIGATRLGDVEPVKSNWTYHICESETKINREFTITAENFVTVDNVEYVKLVLPDYIIGVLGVTVSPIEFVSSKTPITDAQRASVAKFKPEKIYQLIGVMKPPSELTDTEIRLLLGIPEDLDELGSLGSPTGRISPWPKTYEGGIRASFKNYSFDSSENLFVKVDRDRRKNFFRSDNEIRETTQQSIGFSATYNVRNADTHSYTNRSIDDITDKKILINTKAKYEKYDAQKDKIVTIQVDLRPGDKVYVSYVGGKPILRQGIETDMRFYLFGENRAGVLPPNDYVKTWNYKKYNFRLPYLDRIPESDQEKKKKRSYKVIMTDIDSLIDDYDIVNKINQARVLFDQTKDNRYQEQIKEFETQLKTFEVEGQRLCETKAPNGVEGKPFILGCYFIDARGFCSCDFRKADEVKVLVPLGNIGDIATFDAVLNEITSSVPGAYDGAGIIKIEDAKKSLFDDFYFDVDELVNTMCTDNEKFGYERRFANAIKRFKPPEIIFGEDQKLQVTAGTGVCIKLDLIREGMKYDFDLLSFQKFLLNRSSSSDVKATKEWVQRLDLTGAKFEPVQVIGKPSNIACNPEFIQQGVTGRFENRSFVYGGKGTITADALMRTPVIFPQEKLSIKSRIYVEAFQLYNPLRKAGGIWVGTNPYGFPNYAIASDSFNNLTCLAYSDPKTNILKYRIFNNDYSIFQIQKLKQQNGSLYGLPPTGNKLPPVDYTDRSVAGLLINPEDKTTNNRVNDYDLVDPGFDGMLGDSPGYFNGKEIFLNFLNDLNFSSETVSVFTKTDRKPFHLYRANKDSWKNRNKIVYSDGIEAYFINIDIDKKKYPFISDANKDVQLNSKIYVGQVLIRGELVFDQFSYGLYNAQESTYVEVNDTFDADEEKVISLVFPADAKIIDSIYIDFMDGKNLKTTPQRAKFSICVDLDYTALEPFQLRQRACVFIDNLEIICTDFLTEEEYNLLKVTTNKVSVCFDSQQNLYIFYVDSKAKQGRLEKNGSKNDGSHIPSLNGPGFSDTDEREISCLISSNLGISWYDHKAVVRTKYREKVNNPYAICDFQSNTIHLFYTINSNLMHKKIYKSQFSIIDASLGYQRPLDLTENTPENYGLYHFTPEGIAMRNSISSVVVANSFGLYLKNEIAVAEARANQGFQDVRFENNGDLDAIDLGFADINYSVYKDGSGQFNLLYALNGQLYLRASSNDGTSWYTVLSGMNIHKNVLSQEYRAISRLGHAYDASSDTMYFTYLCDNMLFVRIFPGKINISASNDNTGVNKFISLQDSLSPDLLITAPIFIAGQIPEEVAPYMQDGGNHFVFPYVRDDWVKFADRTNPIYAVSDYQCLGYPLRNGVMRMFYIDYYGNLQGLTFNQRPILDIIYKKRGIT